MVVRESDLETASVTFASMKRKHLKSVVRIEQLVYPQPWSTGLFLSELALKSARDYNVALIGEEVVGYSGVLYVDEESHLTNIAVDPAQHGRSIATRLLMHSIGHCLERNIDKMTLEVRVSNEPALALYRTFGFVPAGVRKNYYSKPTEDALIMWLYDMDSAEYQARLERIASTLESA
jgi:[ribosomal protein S18]-alanine N-acetyltransferase